MGSLFTRQTAHRHAYAAGSPNRVTIHALHAQAPPRAGIGPQIMPLTAGVATIAADGAPFYNSGYIPGYPSRVIGGGAPSLLLPPRAAQIDLTDQTSWDRPVVFTGVR